MEGSWAYGPIDDPNDPAWHGHAEVDEPSWWRRHRALLVAGLVVLVVGGGLLLALLGGDETGGSDSTRAAPKAAAPATTTPVAPPIDDSTPAVPSAAPQVAPVTPVTTTTGEYRLADDELDDAIAAARSSSEFGTSGRVFGQPGALTGDIEGLGASISAGLEGLALALGKDLVVISGARTRAEQEVLYARYLAGTGNLAAVPGTSRHETGEAADVYVDGVALADVPGARRLAATLGLGFPVPGEGWHVERVATPKIVVPR